MPLYFAYGSNMLRARLEQRIGAVEDFGWSTLHEHRHAFDKLGADGTGKGNITPAASAVVHGVMYVVSDRQLEALHEFEGGYRAVELEVVQAAARVRLHATSYRAIAPAGPLPPSDEYLDYYARGMREHGLPEGYIRMVLSSGRV